MDFFRSFFADSLLAPKVGHTHGAEFSYFCSFMCFTLLQFHVEYYITTTTKVVKRKKNSGKMLMMMVWWSVEKTTTTKTRRRKTERKKKEKFFVFLYPRTFHYFLVSFRFLFQHFLQQQGQQLARMAVARPTRNFIFFTSSSTAAAATTLRHPIFPANISSTFAHTLDNFFSLFWLYLIFFPCFFLGCCCLLTISIHLFRRWLLDLLGINMWIVAWTLSTKHDMCICNFFHVIQAIFFN